MVRPIIRSVRSVLDDGTIEWRLDGKLHREDGPAYIDKDGSTKWFLNGIAHRVGGPAIEASDGYKAWCQNGKYHNPDGPAIIYPDGGITWCLEGDEINPPLKFNKRDPRHVKLMKIKGLYGIMME